MTDPQARIITLPYDGWHPRSDQMPLWGYMENGGFRGVVVAHRRWGMYDDVAEETGYDLVTLRHIKNVCENIESGRRRPDLSFSHHIEVASLPPEKQEMFLQKAAEEKLSARELRRESERDKLITNPNPQIPHPYPGLILADPPWQYDFQGPPQIARLKRSTPL